MLFCCNPDFKRNPPRASGPFGYNRHEVSAAGNHTPQVLSQVIPVPFELGEGDDERHGKLPERFVMLYTPWCVLVLIARIVSFRDAVRRFKIHLISILALVSGLGACRQPGLQEFQPDVPYAGRAVAIDVDPLDPQVALVGSERGGIFRTTDGGAHWVHIDAFPSVAVADLRFIPNTNPAVAIATAAPDAWIDPAVNNGGIWRSADAGLTWSHADLSKLCRAPGRDGRGIGFTPNASVVYVATWDYGVVSSLARVPLGMHYLTCFQRTRSLRRRRRS